MAEFHFFNACVHLALALRRVRFLLRTARRFDIGFDLFNRKLDIENKPLSAIGLVGGSSRCHRILGVRTLGEVCIDVEECQRLTKDRL